MKNDCILAIDIGTSSVKVSVIGADGRTAASASEAYRTVHPAQGYAEQNPEDWWNGTKKALHRILTEDPLLKDRIAAAGVCGHMLGCLPVDLKGNALMNCMIHSDSRADQQYREICDKAGAQRLYEMSGNILDARSTLSKFLWLREEAPDIYKETAKVLQSKDYLTAKLTGNIDTTDCSDASHGELMDIRTCRYDPALYSELGLDLSRLPQIHAGKDIVGYLTQQAALELGLTEGIPVIAGGGDGACSDLGGGNVSPGRICCSLGTTAYFSSIVTEPYIDPKGRVFNIMCLDGKRCSLFGAMQSGGGALNWVMQVLGLNNMADLNELALQAPKGSGGLIFVPYLDGERSPVFDAKARGMFFGLSAVHSSAHLARSAFEGVAFALNSILEPYREIMNVDGIRLIGGGAQSVLWRQILADVWNCRVILDEGAGSSSNGLGIAAAAGTAIGIYESFEQAVGEAKSESVVTPSGENEIYQKEYRIYRELYAQTAEQMHRLSELDPSRESSGQAVNPADRGCAHRELF